MKCIKYFLIFFVIGSVLGLIFIRIDFVNNLRERNKLTQERIQKVKTIKSRFSYYQANACRLFGKEE